SPSTARTCPPWATPSTSSPPTVTTRSTPPLATGCERHRSGRGGVSSLGELPHLRRVPAGAQQILLIPGAVRPDRQGGPPQVDRLPHRGGQTRDPHLLRVIQRPLDDEQVAVVQPGRHRVPRQHQLTLAVPHRQRVPRQV